jgi:hypothetical protein
MLVFSQLASLLGENEKHVEDVGIKSRLILSRDCMPVINVLSESLAKTPPRTGKSAARNWSMAAVGPSTPSQTM